MPPGTIDGWTWEKARHLLFRAGFGGKPYEIDQAVKQGPSATVENLLSGPTRSLSVPEWLEDWIDGCVSIRNSS